MQPLIIYRLTLAKYVDSAFSGEGARRVGGRWTPAGYPAVYTASSIALTVLETLVHTDASVIPPHRVIAVDVPDTAPITVIDLAELPSEWRHMPAPVALQAIGRSWLDASETAILKVPSVIVPQESNYIVNPLQADFKRLSIGKADPFEIDVRLLDSQP